MTYLTHGTHLAPLTHLKQLAHLTWLSHPAGHADSSDSSDSFEVSTSSDSCSSSDLPDSSDSSESGSQMKQSLSLHLSLHLSLSLVAPLALLLLGGQDIRVLPQELGPELVEVDVAVQVYLQVWHGTAGSCICEEDRASAGQPGQDHGHLSWRWPIAVWVEECTRVARPGGPKKKSSAFAQL